MSSILDHQGNPISGRTDRASPLHLGQISGQARGERREWESSATNRLNKAHWSDASDVDINLRLSGALKVLRGRSFHERQNNAIVAGMVRTHKTDIVGSRGPQMSARPRNPDAPESVRRYAANLQERFRDWWEEPDIAEVNAGVDMISQDMDMLWMGGESVWQWVTDRGNGGESGVELRINTVHPRMLEAGIMGLTKSKNTVTMGVEVDEVGRVVAYHLSGRRDPVSADEIEHLFEQREPGQRRGIPWLAPVLQAIADLRDYDDQILDAARQAADYAIMLMSQADSGIEPIELAPGSCTEIERRMLTAIPAGWEAKQMEPKNPPTRYVDYRKERHGDFGRPVGMPKNIVRGDSSDMSFASSRFDARSYDRANEFTRAWYERRRLNRVVRRFEKEARMRGLLSADGRAMSERPGAIDIAWTWGGATHIASDPAKEARGAQLRLENRISSLRDEVATFHGRSLEQHVRQLEEDANIMERANMPDPPQDGESSGPASRELAREAVEAICREVADEAISEYMAGRQQEEDHRAALSS